MPLLTIDTSEAQSRKPIPDDTYPGKISEISGPHKGPKARYVTAVLEITEGEHAGRKFFHNMPVEGQGAGIFVDFVNKMTGSDYDVDELDQIEVDTDDLVGAECGIVTKQEEYPQGSGEMQSKVAKVLRATAGAVEE